VQNSGINLDFDLFLERKSGGPSPQAMDRAGVAGPRVQRGPHSGRRLELSLVAALGHGGLPRRHQRQEGGVGTLAVGSPWAERRRGGLATVESRARWRHSMCEVLGERRVGGGVVWRGGGGAALYILGGGGEGGETAGEVGNGRRRCGLEVVS
jgi:hypothetical protein